MGSPFSSFWLEFGCAECGGGVTDEQLFMFGGVVALGEPLGPQLTPPTLCWYIMESPGGRSTENIINKRPSMLHRNSIIIFFYLEKLHSNSKKRKSEYKNSISLIFSGIKSISLRVTLCQLPSY